MQDSLQVLSDTRPFFVYGTLQTGFKNHVNVVKGRQSSVVRATVSGVDVFHFSCAGFPGMKRCSHVADDAAGSPRIVHGQLMSIPAADYAALLADVDLLEDYYGPGHPDNTYEREAVVAVTEDGMRHDAWAYLCKIDVEKQVEYGAVQVEHGDWKRYMAEHGLSDAGDDWADILKRADAARSSGAHASDRTEERTNLDVGSIDEATSGAASMPGHPQ